MIERYTRPEMGRLWSEAARVRLILQVEAAFLEALAVRKAVPRSELKVLRGIVNRPLAGRAKEFEAKSGHELVGILSAALAEAGASAPNLSRYLHYGLTSSDVLDTVLAIQLRDAANLILKGWSEVGARLKSLARRHRGTWMAGRTHGVHAEPLTFGVKLSGWHSEAQRNVGRILRIRDSISFGKLSGAVGTFAHLSPEIEAEVLGNLGLRPEPVATQVVPRDRHAEYMQALALSAAAVERYAVEIRHLQRTEVLEVSEPFGEGQKGSSAMPHKRNPVLCENLCGLARLVRSYADACVENVALWHERDISHSSVERVAMTDGTILVDFMLRRMAAVLEGLQVYPERMKANLESSLGLVYSQKVLLRLIDSGLGRTQAYEAVQRAALRTEKSRRPFLDELRQEPAVSKALKPAALAACFDPASYGGEIAELLRRGGAA